MSRHPSSGGEAAGRRTSTSLKYEEPAFSRLRSTDTQHSSTTGKAATPSPPEKAGIFERLPSSDSSHQGGGRQGGGARAPLTSPTGKAGIFERLPSNDSSNKGTRAPLGSFERLPASPQHPAVNHNPHPLPCTFELHSTPYNRHHTFHMIHPAPSSHTLYTLDPTPHTRARFPLGSFERLPASPQHPAVNPTLDTRTLHSTFEPCTLHPTPYTLCQTSCNLHLTP